MQEIDLGGDEGYVKITLVGHSFVVSPSEELDEIQKNSERTNRKTGNDLMAVVQERIQVVIAKQCNTADVRVSPNAALAYWETLIRLDGEIAESFSSRLGLRSTSDSTPEPQDSATDECAPTLPMSAD